MLEFKSKSEYNIKGRGKVFCVISQSDEGIVGETVIIDGKKYQVTGQEVMGKIEKGRETGLLVKEIFEQDEPKTLSISVKLTLKQIQKLEKVRTIIEYAPQNKLEDIAKLISPKNLKTEYLFINLNNAKQKIAEVFSDKYFDRDLDLHWIGEVLLIGDHYLQLDDIEFALKTEIEEESLLHFLMKPRKYNLENFWIGKVGRKNKKKAELKKCKENVNYVWEQLQESIASEHFKQTNKFGKEEDID